MTPPTGKSCFVFVFALRACVRDATRDQGESRHVFVPASPAPAYPSPSPAAASRRKRSVLAAVLQYRDPAAGAAAAAAAAAVTKTCLDTTLISRRVARAHARTHATQTQTRNTTSRLAVSQRTHPPNLRYSLISPLAGACLAQYSLTSEVGGVNSLANPQPGSRVSCLCLRA